jgi:hypothetical protein
VSVTLIEVLMNAKHNLSNPAIPMQKAMGLDQLQNAIDLLESGKSPFDDFDEDELQKVRAQKED